MPPPSVLDIRHSVDEMPILAVKSETAVSSEAQLVKTTTRKLNKSSPEVMVPFLDVQMECIEPFEIKGDPVVVSGYVEVGGQFLGIARSYFFDETTHAQVLRHNFLVKLARVTDPDTTEDDMQNIDKNTRFTPQLDEKGSIVVFNFVKEVGSSDAPRIDLKITADGVYSVDPHEHWNGKPDVTVMLLGNRTADIIRYDHAPEAEVAFVERRAVERIGEIGVREAA